MALSCFTNKSHQPTDADLASALGSTKEFWSEIIQFLTDKYAPVHIEWKFTSAKFGWSCRVLQKKRVILYLTPAEGFYYTGFVLGDRSLEVAKQNLFPEHIREIIDAAPKYGEGTGFRLEIHTSEDLDAAKLLAEAKMIK